MKQFSIIIPVYNEEGSLNELYKSIKDALDPIFYEYEVIFINDGSTDSSYEILQSIAMVDPSVKVLNFARNYGQTAAMMAGIDHAHYPVIVPMDSDLQNDPNDIPRLLTKLDEGFDVCSGWRFDRKDHPIKRNFLSRVANTIISRVSGVHLHDYGCSLKAYKSEVIKGVM